MNTLSLRQTITLVGMFVVISVALVVLDRRDALDPVRDGLSSVISPISRTFSSIANGPDYQGEVENELERTQAELDAARAEIANLNAQIAEYEVLDEENRVESNRPELNYVPAQVIGRDPAGAQYFIIIDKGTEDGVDVGMAVTDPDFYVGQVIEADAHTAKVLLIIDTSATVGAQLMESRADGIVTGQWQKGGRMLMENVDGESKPEAGDYVVTSESASTETRGVPPNIVIGQVIGDPIESKRTNDVSLEVRPAVDFDELETVWVVMPNDEEE